MQLFEQASFHFLSPFIRRTAEALGVQHVWIISPSFIQPTLVDGTHVAEPETTQCTDDKYICLDTVTETTKLKSSTGQTVKRATESEKRERAMHHLFARKATEWLTVREFDDTKSCIDALRADGRQIWVTDLSQVAVCLTEGGLMQHLQNTRQDLYDGKLIPEKVAIVFGTEAVGLVSILVFLFVCFCSSLHFSQLTSSTNFSCTTEMLNAADVRVYLPLRGFADSLNLSVATALVVHQMFILDPTLVGAMSEEERRGLRRDWYARLASQRLLSSSQKKNRAKLIAYIKKCEEIGRKINEGERVDPDEVSKWEKMEVKKIELDAIDKKVMLDAQTAVRDLAENPPEPITDMRRADEHRVCYVGRSTKNKYGELWEDMPATANAQAKQMASAAFFRERVDGALEEKKFSS